MTIEQPTFLRRYRTYQPPAFRSYDGGTGAKPGAAPPAAAVPRFTAPAPRRRLANYGDRGGRDTTIAGGGYVGPDVGAPGGGFTSQRGGFIGSRGPANPVTGDPVGPGFAQPTDLNSELSALGRRGPVGTISRAVSQFAGIPDIARAIENPPSVEGTIDGVRNELDRFGRALGITSAPPNAPVSVAGPGPNTDLVGLVTDGIKAAVPGFMAPVAELGDATALEARNQNTNLASQLSQHYGYSPQVAAAMVNTALESAYAAAPGTVSHAEAGR